jgi:hypothetical protein
LRHGTVYNRSVPRKPTKPATRQWRITLIRKKGARLGTVEAPDAETAIKIAIEQFGITDPERQRRLVAQPIE